MSWYDNIFLGAPDDEPEPIMEIGTYGIYHNDIDYDVTVDLIEPDAYFKDTMITSLIRCEEDGVTKVECINDISDEDYELIVEKILEINKNDRD